MNANNPPKVAQLAEQTAAAMVSAEPPQPLGWVVVRDEAGRGVYLIAVVMGTQNIDEMNESLAKLRPHMKRVDVFDGTPGEPEETGDGGR